MNLEEFKEYAKTVTREELLSQEKSETEFWLEINQKNYDCPKNVGIGYQRIPCVERVFGNNREYCKNCWKQALKGIKFKEDIKFDNVQKPSHYNQGKFETIEIIEDITKEGFESYLVGNILKYISRYKHKNGLEDLKKCRWYLDRLINKMEGK